MLYFRDNQGINWKAIIGSHGIKKDKELDYLTEVGYSLSNFTIHPQYQRKQKYYDVGVVKLDKPVLLGYETNTVCLPEVNSVAKLVFSCYEM